MPTDEMVEKVARAIAYAAYRHSLKYDEVTARALEEKEWPDFVPQARAALEAAEAGAVPVAWRYPVGPTFAERSICWAFATSKDEAEKRSIWGGVHPLYASPPSEASREERQTDEAEFELLQNGEFAAGSSGPRDDAMREILHYAAVYGHDGPVEVVEVRRIPIDIATAIRARGET